MNRTQVTDFDEQNSYFLKLLFEIYTARDANACFQVRVNTWLGLVPM